MMIEVLSVTGTIFVLMAIGYVATSRGVFTAAQLPVLGTYVVTFALPALIFTSVASRDVGELLNIGYLVGYALGALAVLTFGYTWTRYVARQDRAASTFAAMGMSCPNSGFIGYPILLVAAPEIATEALALSMVVENVLLMPIILTLAERSRGAAGGVSTLIVKRLLRNPIVLALLAGLVVSAAGLELPEIVSAPVGFIAASSAAVSLIVIGGTLAGQRLSAVDSRVAFVVIGKILLLPAAVWGALLAMEAVGHGAGGDLTRAAVIIAATPAMSIYPILAQHHGQERVASVALLLQTIVSFVTISVLLLL